VALVRGHGLPVAAARGGRGPDLGPDRALLPRHRRHLAGHRADCLRNLRDRARRQRAAPDPRGQGHEAARLRHPGHHHRGSHPVRPQRLHHRAADRGAVRGRLGPVHFAREGARRGGAGSRARSGRGRGGRGGPDTGARRLIGARRPPPGGRPRRPAALQHRIGAMATFLSLPRAGAAITGLLLLLAAALQAPPALAEEAFLPGKTRTPASALPAPPTATPDETGVTASKLPSDPYERVRLFAGTPDFLWIDRDLMPAAHAWVMTGLLDDAASDGLDRDDYALGEIARRFEELAATPGRSRDDARLSAVDRLLTESSLRFLRDLHLGRIDPARAHRDVRLPVRTFDAQALLADALRSGSVSRLRDRAAPQVPMYGRLRKALADYRSIAASPVPLPGIPPLPATGKAQPGEQWEGVPALSQVLGALGDFDGPPFVTDVYEPELVEAVRTFQHRHGLDV